ncbi:MAG: hypothetical protein LAP39_22240 [Acidobacteriia bacterium]|nr:hypothetical protein [Terriglobia bacterium]
MQTLGLSNSTPRTDGRLKSLLWPAIHNNVDLDSVTTQGFWLCSFVGTVTLIFSFLNGAGLTAAIGCFEAVFYFLAGIGVRMQSRIAAAGAFTAYLLGGAVLQKYTHQGFSIPRLIFLALLLSNVRGIWLSATWKAAESGPPIVKLSETWRDKLSDQLPAFLWPKVRIFFYIVAAVEIVILLLELFPITPATSGLSA